MNEYEYEYFNTTKSVIVCRTTFISLFIYFVKLSFQSRAVYHWVHKPIVFVIIWFCCTPFVCWVNIINIIVSKVLFSLLLQNLFL